MVFSNAFFELKSNVPAKTTFICFQFYSEKYIKQEINPINNNSSNNVNQVGIVFYHREKIIPFFLFFTDSFYKNT